MAVRSPMTTRIKVPLRPIPKIIIPHASISRRAFGGGIGAGAFRQNDRASLVDPTGEKTRCRPRRPGRISSAAGAPFLTLFQPSQPLPVCPDEPTSPERWGSRKSANQAIHPGDRLSIMRRLDVARWVSCRHRLRPSNRVSHLGPQRLPLNGLHRSVTSDCAIQSARAESVS